LEEEPRQTFSATVRGGEQRFKRREKASWKTGHLEQPHLEFTHIDESDTAKKKLWINEQKNLFGSSLFNIYRQNHKLKDVVNSLYSLT